MSFEMCNMCSVLLTLLDEIELSTDDVRVLELSKQRFSIAEDFGLKVIIEGEQASSLIH